MARLGDVCRVVSGTTPKSSVAEYWDGSVKWITPAELTEDSYIITDSIRHITDEAVKASGLKPFPAGTVILSSRAPIGKTAIAGCEMYCNQGFKNLICSNQVYNKYLYWYLTCKTAYLNSLGRGATFKEISKEIVENIDIPLPSWDEQVKITDKFEKLATLIALRKKQLSKLDELIQARFIELFAKYENGPSVTTVEEISEMVTVGIANSATHAYANDGIIMFRNQNIKEGHLDDSDLIFITPEFANKYKTKALKENDLLITRTGYPGIACIVPKKYEGCQTFTTLIVRLRKDNTIRSQYVCSYINSMFGRKYVDDTKVGVAQQNFGAKALDKMPIFIPPVEEQIIFEQFVEQTDKLKLKVKQSLKELETLKKALIQKYFE